jgi:hypothetical protein
MQPTAQAVGSKSQIRGSPEGATETTQAHEGEAVMNPKSFIAVMVLLLVAGFVMIDHHPARAGEVNPTSGYKVLEPIRHGNLTVFPVVAAKSYPTGEFLTLDEGLHSGEVIVT